MNNLKKICLLCVYWGELPVWIPYFLESCKLNPEVDFIVFSDRILPEGQANNVVCSQLTIEQFNLLATNKLGFNVQLSFPYKVCDFKPTFGKIFEDYICDYSFWGYCDMDLIFGRIRNYITDVVLYKFDIISVYQGFLSGPFCLFRNNPETRILYQNSAEYKSVLKNTVHLGFDENISRKELHGFNFQKVLVFLLFLIKLPFKRRVLLLNVAEIRYQFQWYYKRYMLKGHKSYDMTEVAWQASKEGSVKLYCKDLLLSGEYFRRNRKSKWNLVWNGQGLFNAIDHKELFAFHFRSSIFSKRFHIDPYMTNHFFRITEKGVFISDEK